MKILRKNCVIIIVIALAILFVSGPDSLVCAQDTPEINSSAASISNKTKLSPLGSILTEQARPSSGIRHIDLSSEAPSETLKPIAPERPDYSLHPDLQEKKTTAPAKLHRLFTQQSEDKNGAQESPAQQAKISGDFSELRLTGTASVIQIIDPLRIQLKDGRIIQLAGIDVPGMDAHEPGEYAIAARDFLTGLLTQKTVRFYQTKDSGTGRMNRMGHHLAHLEIRDSGIWAQGALLANGMARIYPTTRNTEMAKQMIAMENSARENKKGLWGDETYAMLTPETALRGLDEWALVEGRVFDVATVRNTVYLNFGKDWRKDFTIAIEPSVRKALSKEGIDPMKLKSKKVRVRGWMEEYNGPFIRLNHAQWLEIEAADNASGKNALPLAKTQDTP